MAEPDEEPMCVWPNRVPIPLRDEWKARAKAEAKRTGQPVTSSGMLRHVMEEALARPRIIPAPAPVHDVAPADCSHPSKDLRRLGYATLCPACGTRIR